LESLKDRDDLEDTGLNGRVILHFILKKCTGRVNWINLAADADSCFGTLFNMGMHF
jgi:hypothetical protein